MGFELQRLAEKARTIKIPIYDGAELLGEINVEYNLRALNADLSDWMEEAQKGAKNEDDEQRNIRDYLAKVLTGWDLEDGGTPIPHDNPDAMRCVPTPILQTIMFQINDDAHPKVLTSKRWQGSSARRGK